MFFFCLLSVFIRVHLWFHKAFELLSREASMTTHKTARDLSQFLAAQLDGDPSLPISGLASPESAGHADLIYVDSSRHLDRAAASAARCVLLPPDLSLPGKTLLRSPQPKLAFAKAAAWLLPAAPIATGIHPTAVISPTARLASGVAVGPYAVIEDDVSIAEGTQIAAFCFLGRGSQLGAHCRLYPRSTLYAGVRLGNRVLVHSGAVIGSDGFGYVTGEGKHLKFPQLGSVEIADDVEIGANSTLDRGSLSTTRLDSGVKLDNLVHIAHNVTLGAHCVLAAQTGIAGSSTLGHHVVGGGQLGVADHVRIEDEVQLGAQTGVFTSKRIPRGRVVWGTPARPVDELKRILVYFGRLPELAARVEALEKKSTPARRRRRSR